MRKLARVAGIAVTGLSVAVPVTFGGPRRAEAEEAFRAAWHRCLGSPAALTGRPIELVLADGAEARQAWGETGSVTSAALDQLLVLATQLITRSMIEAQAGHLLMFHAGAVAHPDTGETLVFVAPGGTGKTTLASVLGRTLGYVTDECVGIDADGVVHPYPKPLSQRVDGGEFKREVAPGELGLLPCPPRPRATRVVLLRRDSSTGAMPPRELSLLDAIAALAPESSSLSRLDAGLHRVARLIDRTGPVQLCRYREAHELARTLAPLIGGAA